MPLVVRVTVKISLSVWLVSGYAHVFIVLSVVIVTHSITSYLRVVVSPAFPHAKRH